MAWKCMVTALSVFIGVAINGGLSAEDDVQAFVDSINSKQSTWTAKERDITNLKNQLLLNKVGADVHRRALQDPAVQTHEVRATDKYMPESYDTSKEYPECNIRRVKYQHECGCCWAVASAGVMQDRLCIHSNGQIKVNISAAHLVGCCKSCGPGCNGGASVYAFSYMMKHGVVTGGEYKSNDGCYPYPLCQYCTSPDRFTCPGTCPNENYDKDMDSDRYYVQQIRTAGRLSGGATAMQYELFTNGPMVAIIEVYDDFMYYESGIYKHTEGNYIQGHYVRLIGYGSENGVDYWIGVNSWNDWGESGAFRILRGVNESGIETYGMAPIPVIPSY